MVYGLVVILAAAVLFMGIKIYSLKRSAREIADEFADRLQTDTNTLINITSSDKDMCRLAEGINRQLAILRKEHLQYYQGNTELKNAVTNISHDLRTPLTAIAGNLYMIGRTDELSEIREYVAAIGERTEAMKQLTDEMFRYSMIVSGDSEAAAEELFVNRVLQESLSSFYPVLTENGIEPQIHITEAKVMRNVNRSDLTRVFSNLLNNAVKYSDGDLEITLSDAGEIIFSNMAKDLSAVRVEQLFDRFYTVEVAHNSTGLGLSIARTLVERMGGTISADYENGRLTIKIKL